MTFIRLTLRDGRTDIFVAIENILAVQPCGLTREQPYSTVVVAPGVFYEVLEQAASIVDSCERLRVP